MNVKRDEKWKTFYSIARLLPSLFYGDTLKPRPPILLSFLFTKSAEERQMKCLNGKLGLEVMQRLTAAQNKATVLSGSGFRFFFISS